jgi:hypothetical protein
MLTDSFYHTDDRSNQDQDGVSLKINLSFLLVLFFTIRFDRTSNVDSHVDVDKLLIKIVKISLVSSTSFVFYIIIETLLNRTMQVNYICPYAEKRRQYIIDK